MAARNWRYWFHVLHRDIGYACVGLTLVYAVSGIAVNHVADWNPSYVIEKVRARIEPVGGAPAVDDALARRLLASMELSPDYNTLFVPGPGQVRIIRQNHTIDVELASGSVLHEIVTPRFLLADANAMHLNHAKRAWTWFADAFAVALIVLAITGMFLIKGKHGITGRGAWLTALGFIVPLALYWWAT